HQPEQAGGPGPALFLHGSTSSPKTTATRAASIPRASATQARTCAGRPPADRGSRASGAGTPGALTGPSTTTGTWTRTASPGPVGSARGTPGPPGRGGPSPAPVTRTSTRSSGG